MRGRTRAAVVVALVLCASVFVSTIASAEPTIFRHPVYGGGEAYFGTCTESSPPGTVCIDNYVLLWQGLAVLGGGAASPVNAPWHLYIRTERVEWGTAEEPDVTLLREGEAVFTSGATSDQQHLTNVSVSATAVPMSDGTTYNFAATWTAWSDRLVFGVDGPATGVPHNYVDRCLTFVANGHQKFRFAHMSGTLNGAAIQSYTDFNFGASIFSNDFQYIEAEHGGDACD